MMIVGLRVFNQISDPIKYKLNEQDDIQKSLNISNNDYASLIEKLNTEKEDLLSIIDTQYTQINAMESESITLTKEEVLQRIGSAVGDTGATFSNFYVTNEGELKSDYSVEIQGNIYQITEFVQNLSLNSPVISFGNFSIRENMDSSFLTRYFDDSNLLSWFDGSIYGVDDQAINNANDKEGMDNTESVDNKDNTEVEEVVLPDAKDIQYVMTITFRL